MENLHVMFNSKFMNPYIKFIRRNFDIKKHYFAFFDGIEEDEVKIMEKDYITKIEDMSQSYRLIKMMVEAKKIFIHSLFSHSLVELLYFHPWLLKKCNWVIWGGDLYDYCKYEPKNWYDKFIKHMREKVIKRIGGFSADMECTHQLIKKEYKSKAKGFYTFAYPSNVFEDIDIPKKNNNKNIVIQVGNSGDPTNQHLKVFEKIKKFYTNNQIEIICPLSYSNEKWIEIVLSKGKDYFGNNFNPLLDFLPFKEYKKLLTRVDIAIFNHKRPQAMGNTILLLGMGKKVYIRHDIPTWDYFKSKGIKIFSTINSPINTQYSEEDKKNNMEKIKEYFSYERLKKQWFEIFNFQGVSS